VGKFALLLFFFGVSICLSQTRVSGMELSVPEEQTPEAKSDGENILPTVADIEMGEQEPLYVELETVLISDPIQPYNRAIFDFNDDTYRYVMKPISTGYKKAFPKKVRISIRNFFLNIKMPVRFVNCLLQGKIEGASTEMARFIINTTIGLGGIFDPAKSQFHLERQDEDFGQTLAKYKLKSGPYIEWPFLGPSTVRDTIGYVGDTILNPVSFLVFVAGPLATFGTNAFHQNNEISLDKGVTYENITEPAIDPYIALQYAYIQYRHKKIKE